MLLAVFAVRLLAVFSGRLALDFYVLPGFVFHDWLLARFIVRCVTGFA